ncbi:hypothetical protein E5D57_006913 [Metarhizium anisopliae]|nr:hypothetical protein E5D57_006913 [Metarhizium anisopliae]
MSPPPYAMHPWKLTAWLFSERPPTYAGTGNKAGVQRAVDNQVTASRALAGVINLAMVLRDVAFADPTNTSADTPALRPSSFVSRI